MTTMSRRLRLAAAALALTPLCALAAPPAKKEAPPQGREWFDPWTDFQAWSEQVRKDLEAGKPVPMSRFDQLFDDAFFRRRPDSFDLIEEFDRRFQERLAEQEKGLFGDSWKGWYQDRLGLGEVKEKEETTDASVILVFEIPGLDAKSVNLDINGDRVRLSYSARTSSRKTDAKGRVVARTESSQRFEKIVPVPPRADPEKYRVEKKGNAIRVIFERRRAWRLKS